MIAVDTNILIYAHRSGFPEHRAARNLINRLAEGSELWGVPVFCLAEFLRVITHPDVLKPPTGLKQATGSLEVLLDSPSLRVLSPGEHFPAFFLRTVTEAKATGNLIFDAQIVAVCREQGIETICTNDRDFARFPGIKVQRLTG